MKKHSLVIKDRFYLILQNPEYFKYVITGNSGHINTNKNINEI